MCDHTLLSNSSRFTRPCSREESYTSTSNELTLEQTLVQGSVLYPLDFTLRYEFVDTHLEGAPSSDKNPCDRIFKSSNSSPRMGIFQSPRTVFYYGRGGSRNLSCLIKFEAAPGERVQVTLTRAKFGDRNCVSEEDSRTGRWRCSRNDSGAAELWVSEYPWPGVQLPRHCICSPIQKPIILTAVTSSVLDVNFTITLMNITQDYNDFYFEGEYQFIPAPSEEYIEACGRFKSDRRLRGSSGDISFPSHSKKIESNLVVPEKKRANRNLHVSRLDCENHPWLIEPVDNINNFVYLKIRGIELLSVKRKNKSGDCPTRNRVVVYSGIVTRQPRVICPLEGFDKPRTVEIFSDGWNNSSSLSILNPSTRRIVVEYLEREPGTYTATWMEVFKRPLLTSTSSLVMSASSIDCPYRSGSSISYESLFINIRFFTTDFSQL